MQPVFYSWKSFYLQIRFGEGSLDYTLVGQDLLEIGRFNGEPDLLGTEPPTNLITFIGGHSQVHWQRELRLVRHKHCKLNLPNWLISWSQPGGYYTNWGLLSGHQHGALGNIFNFLYWKRASHRKFSWNEKVHFNFCDTVDLIIKQNISYKPSPW